VVWKLKEEVMAGPQRYEIEHETSPMGAAFGAIASGLEGFTKEKQRQEDKEHELFRSIAPSLVTAGYAPWDEETMKGQTPVGPKKMPMGRRPASPEESLKSQKLFLEVQELLRKTKMGAMAPEELIKSAQDILKVMDPASQMLVMQALKSKTPEKALAQVAEQLGIYAISGAAGMAGAAEQVGELSMGGGQMSMGGGQPGLDQIEAELQRRRGQ
jgi:hypothetical protein